MIGVVLDTRGFSCGGPSCTHPDDDMILELATAARCGHIITHNVADLRGSERFGAQALTPGAFLRRLGQST